MAIKISHKDAIRLGAVTESGETVEYEATRDEVEACHDESLEHNYWDVDDDGIFEWCCPKKGYIACEPSEGDHISDHDDVVIRDSWDEAMKDRTENRPAVRRIGLDDYLYID